MNTNKIGIIVLGGHVQGYGVVRVYGVNNIPSVVIDTTNHNIARHSKYCVYFYQSNYQNLIELLLEFGKEGKYKGWLLIPTDDYYVRLLSQNKNLLSDYFKVTVDEWNVIELFFNKRKSYPLVDTVGVPIPKTFYPNSIEDLNEIEKNIEYPCIIKPAVMLDFYRHFKQKVFVCNSFNELHEYYFKAIEIVKPEEILIQEIIPGNSENQYSVGIFFDRALSYNHLVARRKRQHPIDFGNATTFAETVDLPLLIEYAEKILYEAKFFGICEVEFKYDERDNKFKFLEVNPRTWKWHIISQLTGIPFLMSLFQYLTCNNPMIKKEYSSCSWQDIITDMPVLLNMLLHRQFNKSNSKHNIQAVLNKKDILPFLYQLFYVPYLIIKR